MPYVPIKVTLDQLWRGGRTGQHSLTALRARVYDGILVYEESQGATQYFDEQLSIVRLRAASKCKRPKVTWGKLKAAMKSLDRSNVNNKVKAHLNDDGAASAVDFLRGEIDKVL